MTYPEIEEVVRDCVNHWLNDDRSEVVEIVLRMMPAEAAIFALRFGRALAALQLGRDVHEFRELLERKTLAR